MKTPPKKLTPRKLLVASVGVATLNYVALACNGKSEPLGDSPTSGNLPAPQPTETAPPTSGNLPAPQPLDAGPAVDGGADASTDAGADADAGS